MAEGSAPGYLDRFREIVAGSKWVFTYVVVFGSAPIVLNFVFGIGPPWPNAAGVALLTSMVAWGMLIYAYVVWGRLSIGGFRKVMRWAGPSFAGALVVYIGSTALFAMRAPDFRHQVAAGFVLRPTIVEVLNQHPEETPSSLLKGAQYDATLVWEGWSVGVVRFLLLASWLATVTPFFLLIALLVLMEKTRAERAGATKRNRAMH